MNGIPITKDFQHPLETARLFSDLKCPWGIAGGWAVDLFLNRVTREHHDVEVAFFRDDQNVFQQYLLSRHWSLRKVVEGKFHPWIDGERLSLPVHEIWCDCSGGAIQQLELLLNERTADSFVFRRNSSIRQAIERTFLQSESGIPILAPEIVLLYKSKRASDPKEQSDFSSLLPALDFPRRRWLSQSLETLQQGHVWRTPLNTPQI